jgi:hypothetical protein
VTTEDPTDPEWEILSLLREVRRRARSASARAYLARLREEPRWVAALPAAEARIARTMLEATREMALRAADPLGEMTAHAQARPRKASGRRRAR